MRPSWRLQVLFVVFARIASAALVNVTIDDAVLAGALVPLYLPSPSKWNTNNCTGCFVKPDPLQAYNGTWHDTTFSASNGFTQVIDFTFTGSALFIFFIIANIVPGADTLTDIQFVLDQAIVGRYTHPPSTTTDFQYNVAVYANDSIPLGQHNMMIEPVNTGSNILMLFDYLIYTMDASSSSLLPSAITSVLSSPTSRTGTPTSVPSVGAIAGGTVGGVVTLSIVAAALLCYLQHKRRNPGGSEVGAVINQFTLARDEVTTGTPASTHPTAGTSVTKSTPRFRTGTSPASVPLSNLLPSTIPPPSSGAVLIELAPVHRPTVLSWCCIIARQCWPPRSGRAA